MAAGKKLVYHVTVADEDGALHTFGPDSDVPGWAVKAITNPKVWEGYDESAALDADDEADGGTQPYSKWLKADLEAEVERRNEGREDDDLIVVGGTGKVADLAAALDADDEA